MTTFDLYAEIAKWLGWPAVSALLLLVIGLVFYMNKQHVAILQEEILKLQRDLDNFRDFHPDPLLKRLLDRHAVAMSELDQLQGAWDTAETQRKKIVEFLLYEQIKIKELSVPGTDRRRKTMLDRYGHLDYCDGCKSRSLLHSEEARSILFSDHFVNWDAKSGENGLKGEIHIVEKYGECNNCTSPVIKCGICKSITGLYLYAESPSDSTIIECKGKCGVKYQLELDLPVGFSIVVFAPESS